MFITKQLARFTKSLPRLWKNNRKYFGSGPAFAVNNPLTGSSCIEYKNSDTQNDMKQTITQMGTILSNWNKLGNQTKKSHIQKFIDLFEQNKSQIVSLMHSSTARSLAQCIEQYENSLEMLVHDLGVEYKTEVKKAHGKYYLSPFDNILVSLDHRTPLISTLKYLVQCAVTGASIIFNPQRYALPVSKAVEKLWIDSVPDYPIIYCPINRFTDGLQFLVQHEKTGFVSFTGDISSGNNFYHFMAMHSQIFAQSEFLLASNDAAYVNKSLSEKSLTKCVECVAKGAFSGAGNYPESIKRIFVDQQIKDTFIKKFLLEAQKYKVKQNTSQISAVITSNHIKIVKQHIKEFQQYKGQELKLLSQIEVEEGSKFLRVSPIVFAVDGIPDIQYWQKIYPMPVVFIQSVSSPESCIEKINESIYGISASIFTEDQNISGKVGNQVNVGSVWINRWGFSPGVPYSGRKRSGKGSSFSNFTLTNIFRTKSISNSQ